MQVNRDTSVHQPTLRHSFGRPPIRDDRHHAALTTCDTSNPPYTAPSPPDAPPTEPPPKGIGRSQRMVSIVSMHLNGVLGATSGLDAAGCDLSNSELLENHGGLHAEGPWSREEVCRLFRGLLEHGRKWQMVTKLVETRSCSQVRQKGLGVMTKLVKQFDLSIGSITSRSSNEIHPELLSLIEEQLETLDSISGEFAWGDESLPSPSPRPSNPSVSNPNSSGVPSPAEDHGNLDFERYLAASGLDPFYQMAPQIERNVAIEGNEAAAMEASLHHHHHHRKQQPAGPFLEESTKMLLLERCADDRGVKRQRLPEVGID